MKTILCLLLILSSCMTIEPAKEAGLTQAVLILAICHQRQVEDHVSNPNYCR